MSMTPESPPEIVSAVRLRCGGIEFGEDGRVELAIVDLHRKVDAVVVIYADGRTRVSCPYFDRDRENFSVCRASEHKSYFRTPIDDDSLPHCTHSFDKPGESENHLTRHEIAENEEEVEEELDAEKMVDEEDCTPPEDYVPEQ